MTVIASDLDGTVCEFLHGAAPLVTKIFGLQPDFNNLYTPPEFYTTSKLMDDVFSLPAGTFKKEMEPFLVNEMRLFKNLPRLEEDNYLLTRMLYNHFTDLKLYFITARDPDPLPVADTYYWVNNNGYEYDEVFHIENKASFCSYMGINLMIEDEPRQIIPLYQNGVNVIIMNQPWNDHIEEVKNKPVQLRRAYNWQDVFSLCKEILG